MKYINETLADEVITKFLHLKSTLDPSSQRLKVEKTERKAMQEMAQIHSYRIEHPELQVPFCVPSNCNRGRMRRGIERLNNAFKWGCSNFNPKNFDESFLREIAFRILPKAYEGKPTAEYRERGTTITGALVTPPYPEKLVDKEIPMFEEAMRRQLLSSDPSDTLETAIFAHFHVVRMHPFVNGNGRTARILQDVILHDMSFPVPVIQAGERTTYYNLLNQATYAWKNENNWENPTQVTPEEKLFYDFMAGKINTSLDRILEVSR